MKVILFGGSGVIGQSVLRECLNDPRITQVLSVGRRPVAIASTKLQQIVHGDLHDLASIEPQLAGYDACVFCLGSSPARLFAPEAQYRKTTHDLTLAIARVLVEKNPRLRFVYVSGSGTDATGTSRQRWARVKGETENALLALPFEAAYMFRPGFIPPRAGLAAIGSRALSYALLAPIYPLLDTLAPDWVSSRVASGDEVARAMVEAITRGAPKRVLENADIRALAARAQHTERSMPETNRGNRSERMA